MTSGSNRYLIKTIVNRTETYKSKEEQSHSTSLPTVRPWIRYLARLIDIYLFTMFVTIILVIFFNLHTKSYDNDKTIALLSLWVLPFAEAFFITNWGTTPGKWLLKTTVVKANGGFLSYKTALLRAYWAIGEGLGMGIPFVSLITLFISYKVLENKGITKWDAHFESIVLHERIGTIRTAVNVVLIISIIALIAYANIL